MSKLDIDFMKSSFKEFDIQSKGYLEPFELGVFMNSLGMKANEEKVKEMLQEKNVQKLDIHGLI